ncbi:hypothetical protein V8E36_009175 [Tilletia maclaganii]
MKILFIGTAFNSLSQRLALVLRELGHAVTVELALSPELMITAAHLAQPDIVVCPFLTKRVPREVYTRFLTLIVHPGPPHDAGPSALDFCLIGDDGAEEDAEAQLAILDARDSASGAVPSMRSHWGVTVLQAIEQFDAGPIWAFDQFALDDETRKMTKSDLYRGPVTRCAVNGVLAAIQRISDAAAAASPGTNAVDLTPPTEYRHQCVSNSLPFQGGPTRDRPLLKASSRDFVLLARSALEAGHRLNADVIVQRINCGDSQPGVLSALFGAPLFLYDARVQRGPMPAAMAEASADSQLGTILATRQGAVLVNVGADAPIWIAHVRKPKAKADRYLAPKLPAVQGLLSIEMLAEKSGIRQARDWPLHTSFGKGAESRPWARQQGTYQQVWVDLESVSQGDGDVVIGYVYFDFYNGATATEQCQVLLQAIEWTLRQPGLKAIVLMGGAGYFSNGIALNVIEGAEDPSAESWFNINAIDDCVRAVLAPSGVLTFAAIRANCAAGGLALATACDVVLSAESAVLNPHYRGLGLYGSEYHTYSWYERCGPERAADFARTMLPMSAQTAKKIGLVDVVLGSGTESPAAIEALTKRTVERIMASSMADAQRERTSGSSILNAGAPWTRPLFRQSTAKPEQRLAEHYLACKRAYLTCLFASRMAGSTDHRSPQGGKVVVSFADGFAQYRKAELDNMTLDFFHPVRGERYASRRLAFVRKLAGNKSPARFALHRRLGATWAEAADGAVVHERDEEELDEFDGLGDVPAQVAFDRLAAVLRAQASLMPRSASQNTVMTAGSDGPELAVHSAGPSPPDTPHPSSPKEALDLQDECLAVPTLLDGDGGNDDSGGKLSLTAPSSLTTHRSASITFVPALIGGESHGSAPRTAKVARMSGGGNGPASATGHHHGRRYSRSFTGFNFGSWGKEPGSLTPSSEESSVVGLAIDSYPSGTSLNKSTYSSSTATSHSSAASRLFNSIARKGKASISNLRSSSTSTSATTNADRISRRASMQMPRASSVGVPVSASIDSDEQKEKIEAAPTTAQPQIIYACYYNSGDKPLPGAVVPAHTVREI